MEKLEEFRNYIKKQYQNKQFCLSYFKYVTGTVISNIANNSSWTQLNPSVLLYVNKLIFVCVFSFERRALCLCVRSERRAVCV